MTRRISQRELRNQSGEIMRALDRGEDFVITSNGRPVGELRPIGARTSVPREVALAAFAGAARVEPRQFFADIDALVDQAPEPRDY